MTHDDLAPPRRHRIWRITRAAPCKTSREALRERCSEEDNRHSSSALGRDVGVEDAPGVSARQVPFSMQPRPNFRRPRSPDGPAISGHDHHSTQASRFGDFRGRSSAFHRRSVDDTPATNRRSVGGVSTNRRRNVDICPHESSTPGRYMRTRHPSKTRQDESASSHRLVVNDSTTRRLAGDESPTDSRGKSANNDKTTEREEVVFEPRSNEHTPPAPNCDETRQQGTPTLRTLLLHRARGPLHRRDPVATTETALQRKRYRTP